VGIAGLSFLCRVERAGRRTMVARLRFAPTRTVLWEMVMGSPWAFLDHVPLILLLGVNHVIARMFGAGVRGNQMQEHLAAYNAEPHAQVDLV